VGLWEAVIGETVVSGAGGPASPPDEVTRRLRAPLRDAKLEEVVRLRSGTQDVAVLDGQRVVRSFPDLETAVRATVVSRPETRPRRREPALEHVRAFFRQQLLELERTDPLVRTDPGDDEALHDLRVALRRLRSVLQATRELFDGEWIASLRAELKWATDELAATRDLDVLLARLADADADAAPIVRGLKTESRRARKKLRKTLDSERYLQLVETVRKAVEAPPVRRVDIPLDRVAAREFQRLRRTMRTLGADAGDTELHRARIQAKRARYAAELVAPTTGKRARRFIRAAKRFQDAVGAHQDSVVAERYIRDVAARANAPVTSFAAGRLVEQERSRRAEAHAAVRPAWKKLRRRGRKAWA
jgi:CHAD domain-containing protein